MLQMFGTGTACAVSPIESVVHRDQQSGRIEEFQIPTMTSGADLMQRFYKAVTDIQYGLVDRPGWVHIVE
jgi:branched-chain amino acid aminotransferase